jgi:SOS-response transcriptional repressor LexA
MPVVRKTSAITGVGPDIVALRHSKSLGQIGLASSLGVDQSTLAKWEKGIRPVPIAVILKLAALADQPDQPRWFQLAGVAASKDNDQRRSVEIKILKDAAACGVPRIVEDDRYKGALALPRAWFTGMGELRAVPVEGTSMEPVLRSGDIAIVDMQKRSISEHLNRIVLARVDDGVTIKILQGRPGKLMLTPMNVTPDNVPVQLSNERDAIVGQVVSWIGRPLKTGRQL